MLINPRENTIVISTVLSFPYITIDNGVKIYYEVKNEQNL